MKRIVLLGASGSIGMQTIDVVTHHSDRFCICALSVGHNLAQLEKLLAQLPQVRKVCVAEEQDHERLSRKYPQLDWYWGEEGLLALAAWSEYDLLVNAVVGFRGLHPTLCAISHRHDVALANKESLVAGGELVKAALREHGVNLYPIDSEHSAIFQCLRGNDPKEVRRLIITASGGSFRDRTREELTAVSVKEALHHPNWNMGGRITIDSATMMNKGFEVIEAHHLFELPYEQIDVLIHRESVIHSMVEYQDNAAVAQLGCRTWRCPSNTPSPIPGGCLPPRESWTCAPWENSPFIRRIGKRSPAWSSAGRLCAGAAWCLPRPTVPTSRLWPCF